MNIDLSKVMSGTAKAAVVHKFRLWLEYAMLALILGLAGFAFYGYMKGKVLNATVTKLETDVANSDARVKEVEEANRQQVQAIKTIQNLTETQTALVSGLSEDLQKIAVRDKTTSLRLSALEKSNAALTQYLDTRIPTPVGCMLDNSCEPAGANGSAGAKPAQGTPAKVPAASGGTRK